MLVREADVDDAEDLINLVKDVEAQSTFMLMNPGERKTTSKQFHNFIKNIRSQHNSNIF